MYKCKYCGKEFETKQKLAGHILWCKDNPNRNGKSGLTKYNEDRKNKLSVKEENSKIIIRECPTHGSTEFALRYDGKYRCKKCSAESVTKRRQKTKEELVNYKGGKCEICGYDKCIAALEFHHINPEEKEFGIGRSGVTRSLKILKKEIDKCMLLCSNCHKEIHYRLI